MREGFSLAHPKLDALYSAIYKVNRRFPWFL